MSIDLSTLNDAPRLLIRARLKPLQGTRFQPTGFPEIGAAEYEGPRGEAMLLVESAQSLANRMEAICWDKIADDWATPLRGLSVVKVFQDKELTTPLTNSVLEAHRINSEYIARADGFKPIRDAIGYRDDRRFSVRDQLAPVLLKYDINGLLHGVFLEEIAGVIRLPRALSGFVEARGVRRATSGGVKIGLEPKRKEGEGNVIFARDEFVSPEIDAYFNLDLAQLRSYGFSEAVHTLLVTLALYKIRGFLEEGLRLRTACDLACDSVTVQRPSAFHLPDWAELKAAIPLMIEEANADAHFEVTKLTHTSAGKRKAKVDKPTSEQIDQE